MIEVKKAEDAIKLAKHKIRSWDKEHLIGLYLDSKNNLKHSELISMGLLDSTLLAPREILQPAILYSSAGFVLLHNHPSGDVKPSKEDIAETLRIEKASKIMGILFIDHIIFSKGKIYYSMRANKKMKGGEKL